MLGKIAYVLTFKKIRKNAHEIKRKIIKKKRFAPFREFKKKVLRETLVSIKKFFLRILLRKRKMY